MVGVLVIKRLQHLEGAAMPGHSRPVVWQQVIEGEGETQPSFPSPLAHYSGRMAIWGRQVVLLFYHRKRFGK